MLQIRDPKASFAALAAADLDDPGLTPAVGRLIAWGLIAGVLDSIVVFGGLREAPQSAVLDFVALLLFPVFAVGLSAVVAGLFHIACQMLGGKAPWRASFRAMASMAWTAPFDILALTLSMLAIPLAFYRLFLFTQAAMALQGLSRKRAMAATLMVAGAAFFLMMTLGATLMILSGPSGPV